MVVVGPRIEIQSLRVFLRKSHFLEKQPIYMKYEEKRYEAQPRVEGMVGELNVIT